MRDKLQNETLPASYTMIKLTPPDIDNSIISIRTEELNIETGFPVIKLNLTIYNDLHYRMHVCNTEIPSSKASKLTNKSGICRSTTEVLDILFLLKTLTVDSKTAMNYAAELLDTTNDEFSSYHQCQFIAEQLRISSVAGNYQDLVNMSPVPRLKSDDIKGIFFKVLKNLTELGDVVVSVTTDGHRTNQSFHNYSLGTEGVHPEFIVNPFSSSKNARVYTIYDTVHLFKNIYFNLLNKKSLCGHSLQVHHNHLV